MVRLLTDREVTSLITMERCIAAVEAGFVADWHGQARVPLRLRVDVPGAEGAGYFMAGYLDGQRGRAFGCKIITGFRRNMLRGLPNVMGTLTLLDPETGATLAIMDGNSVTRLRTGAATGVAAKHLAASNAGTAAIVGIGGQALAQLQAVAAVRPLRQVLAYSPSAHRKPEVLAGLQARLGVPVTLAASAEEACRGAEIVILATSQERPVIQGDWVRPGTFVAAIGYHTPASGELDAGTLAKAERVVCDDVAANLEESGDIVQALRQGLKRRDELIDLGSIVAGEAPGRRNDGEITVFRSIGKAFQDLAVGLEIYRRALEEGVGTDFSFDATG